MAQLEQVTLAEAKERHDADAWSVLETITKALVAHADIVADDVERHQEGSEYVPFYSTAMSVKEALTAGGFEITCP